MIDGNDKKWFHYLNDIISSDLYSAVLLLNYLRYITERDAYAAALEVIELDQSLLPLIELDNMPEAFVVGKN